MKPWKGWVQGVGETIERGSTKIDEVVLPSLPGNKLNTFHVITTADIIGLLIHMPVCYI